MKKDKNAIAIDTATNFRESWTLDNAIYILQHPTVDSKIWAEAVEWLILYGPEEIKKILLDASGYATRENFPDLQPIASTSDGEPCYSVADLADALNIDTREAERLLEEKEKSHGIRHGFDSDETYKIQ